MSLILDEKISDLVANMDNIHSWTADFLSIYSEKKLDNTDLLTPKAFKVPVRIEVVARTDSSNIRLKYGKGQIIFNWERNHDSLRCSEPSKGGAYNNMNGRVPIGEWIHFVWEIESDFMRVSVNGTERLFLEGEFSKVKGQAGIGSAFRSTTRYTPVFFLSRVITWKNPVIKPKNGAMPYLLSKEGHSIFMTRTVTGLMYICNKGVGFSCFKFVILFQRT